MNVIMYVIYTSEKKNMFASEKFNIIVNCEVKKNV